MTRQLQTLIIAHLYPREMNIYGDAGNILTLVKRLEWRGYSAEVWPVEVGESFDFKQADIIFGGGGQDSGQVAVGADLVQRGPEIRAAALMGMPMLLICGLYQLFGNGFTTSNGQKLPGISVFNAATTGSTIRLIGNVTIDSPRFGQLVGFENHSGQTILSEGQAALGRVRKGAGNNASAKYEGAISLNAVGTYLHGPVLPKNPRLADYLLFQALQRKYGIDKLLPLDDAAEQAASTTAAGRPR